MVTDDQLKAMEASAPLLVAEVRRLRAVVMMLGGPECQDSDCPDHDGGHPFHSSQTEMFWNDVQSSYRGETDKVPAAAMWGREYRKLRAAAHALIRACDEVVLDPDRCGRDDRIAWAEAQLGLEQLLP